MKETIGIQNLKCAGCEATIIKTISAFPEVKNVKIDFNTASVCIETESPGQRAAYEQALRRAGYPPVGSANPPGRRLKSYVSCALGKLDT